MKILKKTNILGIIQARFSSRRLPGKVLKPILGKPMLELQIERILKCRNIETLIVATSDHSEDDSIEALCNKLGIFCFRGSLENVLDRFYRAADFFKPDHIVRLTGDCPLSDPGIVDSLISFYQEKKCDYVSNCDPPTLPDGLDAEVFSFGSLKKSWELAKLKSELEHVTLYIRNHESSFSIASWFNQENLSFHRWTVDEPEDFYFVSEIFSHLYHNNPDFNLKDVLSLLKNKPELMKINSNFIRNEGLLRSLSNDQAAKKSQ